MTTPLTRQELLQRGSCCNLGCANCPYKPIDWDLQKLTNGIIQACIRKHDRNVSKAATALGVSRGTIYNNLDKKHRLPPVEVVDSLASIVEFLQKLHGKDQT